MANTKYQNSWKQALILMRQRPSEEAQIPVLNASKLRSARQSNFVKWEITINKEHISDIEKNILTENYELLRKLEQENTSKSNNIKSKWKKLMKKAADKKVERCKSQEPECTSFKIDLKPRIKCN